MWIVCITSVRHVLTVNGYGGRQTKENEKSWCFKGWETLVLYLCRSQFAHPVLLIQGQYIPFFYHLAAEQAQRFGKEEHDDKYDGKTRHKAATSQYTFYNLLKNLFHVAY